MLVDVRGLGLRGINVYHSEDNPPYYHSVPGSIPDLLVRESVGRLLCRRNERLKSLGLELDILDAYRPLAVQDYFYSIWVPSFLHSIHPEKGIEWARRETALYWTTAPADALELECAPPPHSTGGAVDLTLAFINGHRLEMGTIFDDLTSRSRPNHFEVEDAAHSFTDLEARSNRRILFHAMVDAGFAPHPLEWWHFSFGDRLWAQTFKAVPFYGFVDNRTRE